MLLPFNTTKPSYPATIVDRPRLYAQLDEWPTARAVLVHAPAGFGKSSLVSRWLDVSGNAARAVWLSLVESDASPRTFVRSLAGALDTMAPGLQTAMQPTLGNVRIPPKRAMRSLIAALWETFGVDGEHADQRLLVLEDLHLIADSEAAPLLAALLEQGPPSLHYVLLARLGTSLPLTRLYASGQVVEVTASDLRFTAGEVSQFLRSYNLTSSPDELAQIMQRTEGWIVALQLARHSQRGHGTMGEYLGSLRGASQWLARYLTQEVLAQQSPALRAFLLRTSILDAFSAPLCAAVAGVDDAYRWLSELQRKDLFLVPLDGEGRWFRYHHLFQELLQHRLLENEGKPAVHTYHRRAAEWLAGHEQLLPAISHLLQAEDLDQAAALVESRIRPAILVNPISAEQMFDALPPDAALRRPRLMLERCLASVMANSKDLALHVQNAQRSLAEHAPSPAQRETLATELLFYRAIAHYVGGELEPAADLVESVLSQRRHLDALLAGVLEFLQMRLSASTADETTQRRHARRALAVFKSVKLITGQIAVRRELAMLDLRAGRSAEATAEFDRIVAVFGNDPATLREELAWIHIFAGEHSYWQDDLDRALDHVTAAIEIESQFQEEELIGYLTCLRKLYAFKAGRDDLVEEALPPIAVFAARYDFVDWQIRWLLAIERAGEAWQVAKEYHASLTDDLINLPYNRATPYLRAYIARGQDLEDARPLLRHAIEDSVNARDLPKQQELLAFAAWLELQTGQVTAARAALAQVEELVAMTGYNRVLLDIPALAAALATAHQPGDQPAAAAAKEERPLLTAQEQAVLALLAEDRTYEQIAAALTVSINTVRTHVKNIYRKLAVRRRDQAIQQGRKLGLVG